MKKSLGILGIFVAVCLVAAIFGDNFLTGYNLMNLTQRSALFAILSLGAGLVARQGGVPQRWRDGGVASESHQTAIQPPNPGGSGHASPKNAARALTLALGVVGWMPTLLPFLPERALGQ